MEKQNLLNSSKLTQKETENLYIHVTIKEIEIQNYNPATKKTKGQIASPTKSTYNA